jgi:GT2 family glycosyltransferase
MTKTGIVVVTHNSEHHIAACLDCVLRWPVEVVVVDNASSDRTREIVKRYPQVRVIANSDNRGFAAAVNQGMAGLDCASILLLNPDVELLEDLEALNDALSDPNTGAAAGKLVGMDGKPQRGFNLRRFPSPLALALEVLGWNRLWPSNPVNSQYRAFDLDPESPAIVEQPAGAFLMLKRKVWVQLGGFDEGFQPVWFEDVDYLRRLTEAGLLVRYTPAAVARHAGGHAVRNLAPGYREVVWYASLLRYASKHFRHGGRGLVSVAVVTGSCLRMISGVLSERTFRPVVTYAKVMKMAGKTLLAGDPISGKTVNAAEGLGSVAVVESTLGSSSSSCTTTISSPSQ